MSRGLGKSSQHLPGQKGLPPRPGHERAVALLTGGADRPYAFGLATALAAKGVTLDLIANDDLDCPELRGDRHVNFLNLRGDQRTDAGVAAKVARVLLYYVKLIRYAAFSTPRVFHILWNNKFETFDRTLLMLYYNALGKKIVLTAHNVNSGTRDRADSWFNRLTLSIQYRLSGHIFVHTEKMKRELSRQFGVADDRVTVIPFGINNSVPVTTLSEDEARKRLGIQRGERTVLFFGNILPYKGLEYLIRAFEQVQAKGAADRLIIAGRPNQGDKYWNSIRGSIDGFLNSGHIVLKAEYIPDDDTEVYFKAADVLVLPYRHVYQSGVLFLGYSFGLPVIAADVGSLRDEIEDGRTGLVFRPEDAGELAGAIERYFASDLYAGLSRRRQEIRDYAVRRHSWEIVSRMTVDVYATLLNTPRAQELREGELARDLASVRPPSENGSEIETDRVGERF
jgi:glycosyltransferase involved in cell wall biosynthesis